MDDEHIFVIDENVFIWATVGGPVDYEGRYRRVGPDDPRSLNLFASIERYGDRLALSKELWERYSRHEDRLRQAGLAMLPDRPITVIGRLFQAGRVVYEREPDPVALPPRYPDKDRHLADLATATEAIIVTEDGGILRSVRGANPASAFSVVTLDEAIALVKEA